jgi:hypothetical protein
LDEPEEGSAIRIIGRRGLGGPSRLAAQLVCLLSLVGFDFVEPDFPDLAFRIGQEDADQRTGQSGRETVEDAVNGVGPGGHLLKVLPFLEIEGVGIDDGGGAADDVFQEEFGGGQVAAFGFVQEDAGQRFHFFRTDCFTKGLAQLGGTSGKGIAGSEVVAGGEAAVAAAAGGTFLGGRIVRRATVNTDW